MQLFAISILVLGIAFFAYRYVSRSMMQTVYISHDTPRNVHPSSSAAKNNSSLAASVDIVQANLDPEVYFAPGTIYPRGLNLIFFADGYLSWNEFSKDIQTLMRQLQRTEPWKSYSRYNIYSILPKEIDICGVKVKDERKPVLRCSPEKINSYLNKLQMDHFKVIVLSRRDFQSWANISRLADSGIFFSIPETPVDDTGEGIIGTFFLHMVGHAFGLKDEEIFVIAKAHSAAHEPDGPNCAPDKDTAEKWWGDLALGDPRVGYFEGCAANGTYIRPTKGSIMNLGDLSEFVPDYGPVSGRYLRKMLTYCFSKEVYSIDDDPDFFELYPELKECLE